MISRKLGKEGPVVSAVGLGCMGMSGSYGAADRTESIATIHAALDADITLLDTGDFYGMGHNEMLLGEALRGIPRDRFLLSVKFGALRDAQGRFHGYDCRPMAVKSFLAYTLQRLRLDHIDIYRPARLDPAVPIEDTVGAIGDLIKQGYVRHAGLSEVGAHTIRRAAATHPISDVQLEWSLLSRGIEAGGANAVLAACKELAIGITAYGVLSRGLISGRWTPGQQQGADDIRSHNPRFQAGNVEANLALVDALRPIAAARGKSVAQLAIAWVAARYEHVVPLIGAKRRAQLAEALGALDFELSSEEMTRIERAVPPDAVRGTRYPEAHMGHLDSENTSERQ